MHRPNQRRSPTPAAGKRLNVGAFPSSGATRGNSGTSPLRKEKTMLHYALVFLVVGLIAAALGLSGVAGVATQISWVLFLIAIILFVVHLVGGRRTPPVA